MDALIESLEGVKKGAYHLITILNALIKFLKDVLPDSLKLLILTYSFCSAG